MHSARFRNDIRIKSSSNSIVLALWKHNKCICTTFSESFDDAWGIVLSITEWHDGARFPVIGRRYTHVTTQNEGTER